MAALEPYMSAFQGGGGNLTVVDTVPPELLHLVDPHWYKYPPMNELWNGIIMVFMFVIGVAAVCGNAMVIFIFTTTKNLLTPSNILIVNLSISDFLLMFSMAPEMVVSCYYEMWAFGEFLCQMHGVTGSMLGCTSIWTMTMISLDRYNVIVKGIAGKPLTTGGAVMRCAIIWTFASIWSVLPMLGWNRYVLEGNMTACGTDYLNKDWFSRSYIFVYAMFVYYTPLLTICYSYFFILKAVSEHERAMREQAKKMNVTSLRSSDDANKSTEGKLAKVALMTISLWFMAWTPYLAINFAGIFGARHLSPLATIWGSVFAKFSCVYNPIVYGISHPKYRAALFTRFPSLNCGGDGNPSPPADSQSNATTGGDEKTQDV